MDNLVENLIIGGGLSSYICKLLIPNSIIISHPSAPFKFSFNSIDDNKFIFNKIFSLKSQSNSSFTTKSNKVFFHDRNILGGHSEIWGGFVRADEINPYLRKILINNGITIKNINDYGYNSNSDIYQFRDINNKILNIQNILSPDIYGHVTSFTIRDDDLIQISFFNLKKNLTDFINARNVYLACGFVQTLGIINSSIELSNFTMSVKEHDYFLKLTKKIHSYKNGCIIQYPIVTAIAHYFGYNNKYSSSYINRIFSNFYISQFFNNKINIMNFKFKNNFLLTDINYNFGKSIHYFDLRINDLNVNKFIKKFSPNMHIFSSASIENLQPGPISQSLINQIYMALK